MTRDNIISAYPASDIPPEQAAIQLTQDLIRIPSLTPVRPDLLPAARQSLNYIEGYLRQYGANCQRLVFEGGHDKWGYPVDNLYAEWANDGDTRHLCFMGHTDVVAPGNPDNWSVSPWSGVIDDGWIYGRGATDMKGAVATFCAAAASIAGSVQNSGCTVSLIITTDEEWAAVNGSRKVLEWMKKNGKQPDAVIVGEPGSADIPGTHIKIGRRGSLCGTLAANGIQGHAAYQDLFINPNRALALAATILNAHQWTHTIPYFPRTGFEIVALDSGDFSSTSIIPGEARLLWNVRFTTEYTVGDICDTIRKLLESPPDWARRHPDFGLLKRISITANTDTAALPWFSAPAKLAETAIQAIRDVMGLEPEPDGSGGTTDGRFVHEFFPDAEIIELGLPEKGGLSTGSRPADYGTRGGMHQVDERCRVQDIKHLLLCYQKIIAGYAGIYEGKDVTQET